MLDLGNEFNIDNPINSTGMSGLLNSTLVSNTLKPETIEQELINSTETINTENLVSSYEEQLNKILQSNDEEDIKYDETQSSEFINTDDIMSEFDDFDTLLKSVSPIQTEQNDTSNQQKYNNDNQNDTQYTNIKSNHYNDAHLEKQIHEEDQKLILLEKIDLLKDDLRSNGIDINKIPNNNVSINSSMNEIDRVYRVLLIKNSRDRYRELTEEFILSIAAVLEKKCNGENTYLGFQPDLSGYSDSLRVKLRRLRYETSVVANDVLEKYELSPLTRIFIELVPSVFLYSMMKKKNNYNNQLSYSREENINNIRNNS
jgi:hypothetical protein